MILPGSGLGGILGALGWVLASLPSPAMADWGYTHWGMTAEQVVAASSGSVRLLPASQRTRDDDDHWELAASGTYNDGPLRLEVGFTFDTRGGGLKCVMYNALGDDAQTLQTAMLKRYGKPANKSAFASTTILKWTKPDRIELVVGQQPVAAAVDHCAPAAN